MKNWWDYWSSSKSGGLGSIDLLRIRANEGKETILGRSGMAESCSSLVSRTDLALKWSWSSDGRYGIPPKPSDSHIFWLRRMGVQSSPDLSRSRQKIDRFGEHRCDEANPVASCLELLGRQANQVHWSATTNFVKKVAQADTTVEPVNALKAWCNDDDVVVAIRLCRATSVRAKEEYAFGTDLIPQSLGKTSQDRDYSRPSSWSSHWKILLAAWT